MTYKIPKETTIIQARDDEETYEQLNKLTKNEIIERYIYRTKKAQEWINFSIFITIVLFIAFIIMSLFPQVLL